MCRCAFAWRWLSVSVVLLATVSQREPTGAGAEPADNTVLADFSINAYWGTPRVPVTFDGRSYDFLLDTGRTNTSFEKTLSPMLTPTGEQRIVISLHGTMTVDLKRAPVGSIAGVGLANLDRVFCIEHEINRHLAASVHGILGVDAIQRLIIQIDYDRGKLSILRSVPHNAGVRLPFSRKSSSPAVAGKIGDFECAFLLDTGLFYYSAGCLPKRCFDKMVADRRLSVVGSSLDASGAGIVATRDGLLNTALAIAGYEHSALVLSECSDDTWADCILGIGYLRRYVVTFDFPGRAVYLAPGAQFRRIDASHDPGGLQLKRVAGQIVVSNVWGPASDAGAQSGDRLETLNGRSTDALDDIAITRILCNSDRPTSLALRHRDGGVVHLVHDQQDVHRRALERLHTAQPSGQRGATSATKPNEPRKPRSTPALGRRRR